MKKALATAFFLVAVYSFTFSQHNEALIHNLEEAERVAVLKGDTAALFDKLWSPVMVVNAPANRVGTVEVTKMAVRTGRIDYASFERVIERITFTENIAKYPLSKSHSPRMKV